MAKRKLDDYSWHEQEEEEEEEEEEAVITEKDNDGDKEWFSSNSSRVQLMVSMIPIYYGNNKNGNQNSPPLRTLVVRAYSSDTVSAVAYKVQSLTGIPLKHQRFVYSGRHLLFHHTLSHYSIANDSLLHLVSPLKSTLFPTAQRTLDAIVSSIHPCSPSTRRVTISSTATLEYLFTYFFTHTTPTHTFDHDHHHSLVSIFLSSSIPEALLMLYISPFPPNRACAVFLITLLLSPTSYLIRRQAAPILLHFCHLFRSLGDPHDSLYTACRSSLASMLNPSTHHIPPLHFLPFATDLALALTRHFTHSPLPDTATLLTYVSDFSAFLIPLRAALKDHVNLQGPISHNHYANGCQFQFQFQFLHTFFLHMSSTMDNCLHHMQQISSNRDILRLSRPAYLPILKDLNALSKLVLGGRHQFRTLLILRKVSLCYLIINYAKRSNGNNNNNNNNNNKWLLKHKDVTTFECRRHLAMLMFPEENDDYGQSFEMLIDRSRILAESFEYITNADSQSLHSNLFMEFKNEEATGPGVVREWFCYVCRALFNQPSALFVACPSDRKRFYPNSVSKVDPLHLKYFKFCGRVIALALMHKVQVGIVFDRVFFVQLAGMPVTLEDIRDADPCLYNSCKQILEMDSDFIDTDALGLTFVREIEELGSRRVVELCPGGENLIVNSRNREDYVNLLIKNYFVTTTSGQVDHFAQGFADILLDSKNREFFFKILELGDLDCMLHGSRSAICVEDWKKHTDYNGYKESDPQILWFWKVVSEMSSEQKKNLLFFWTSVKYLPIEGFKGLASRLYICKTREVEVRLPSSHTCFFQLCFPAYKSLSAMEDRLRIITQEYVGYSFGTW